MDIKEKLTQAMRQAMKANDDVSRRTTRMVLAAIKQVEVDKQTTLDDAAVMGVNLNTRSQQTSWYEGPTLMEALPSTCWRVSKCPGRSRSSTR